LLILSAFFRLYIDDFWLKGKVLFHVFQTSAFGCLERGHHRSLKGPYSRRKSGVEADFIRGLSDDYDDARDKHEPTPGQIKTLEDQGFCILLAAIARKQFGKKFSDNSHIFSPVECHTNSVK
jgi:hypothetical protein